MRIKRLREKGDYGRVQRVKDCSFQKFGKRMLSGGDLYEREEKFFDLVSSRSDDTVEEWLKSISCPIIRIDGTKPVEENIRVLTHQMQLD